MKLPFPTFGLNSFLRPARKAERISLLPIVLSALFIATLSACRDDDSVFNSPTAPEADEPRAALEVTEPGGLTQLDNGTWVTNDCRVPLVGPGRVVNKIATSFVSALEPGNDWSKVLDTDLTNSVKLGGVAKVPVGYQTIASVKDLYRTYAKGQKAGFIYKESGGLLDLSVLKSMTIELLRAGKVVATAVVGGGEGSVLGLDLLSFNKGNNVDTREVSIIAPEEFDEIRMGANGIDVAALTSGFSVFYAFVGENPEIRATSEESFKGFWKDGTPVYNDKMTQMYGVNLGGNWWWKEPDAVVDANIENNAHYTIGVGLGAGGRYTVNFKNKIPAGYEMGYCYANGQVLGLDLLGMDAPILRTYDKDENNRDKSLETSRPIKDLLGVGLLSSTKSKISMVNQKDCYQLMIDAPGFVDVGSNMKLYYAYVRKPTTVDPSAYFTFGNDTTYTDSYRLPLKPAIGSVKYVLLSAPYGVEVEGTRTVTAGIKEVDGQYILTGTVKQGVYRVQALYTAEDGRQISQIANIYRVVRKDQSGCNTYITADSHGAYATEAIGWQGCLLCLFGGTNNANAVVDKDPNNYASRYGLLNLASFEPFIAIQMNKPVSPAGKTVRAGFVIQPNNGLLGLKLLKKYEIRLYNKGQLVKQAGGENGEVLGLGLVNSSREKVRISTTTNQEFDRIELWGSDVLSLSLLKGQRIYNVFYEDVSCDDALPSESCMEVMTYLHHGLELDYETMSKGFRGVSIGAYMDGLGYLLDGSLSTGVLVSNFVDLLSKGSQSLAFKFNRIENQPIGVVLEGLPDLLTVDLLESITFKVFDGEQLVGSVRANELLGLNLLTKQGRTYLEVYPKPEKQGFEQNVAFDRAVLELGSGLAKVASNIKVTGLYTRPDRDGDGVPDCSDPEDETPVEMDPSHCCEGDVLNVKATTEASEGTFYLMECKNITTGKTFEREVELVYWTDADGKTGKYFRIDKLPRGEYGLSLYTLGSGEHLYNQMATVHPLLTEWKKSAASDTWSDWDNWTEGSPWECTNVIIPTGCKVYPSVKEGDCCANIHIEDKAAVLNTHLLTYETAFVAYRIKGGQTRYFSAPLQEMVTGDMFISKDGVWGKENYFTVMNKGNYAEYRISPVVYQRVWGSAREGAYELTASGESTKVTIDESGWSNEFNSVTMKYEAGQGVSLRAGGENDYNSYCFRFPKAGYGKNYDLTSTGKQKETYSYYRESGIFVREETFTRNRDLAGRFLETTGGEVTVTLKADKGEYFLVGNPYMAYVKVKDFMTDNGITELKVYDGNTNHTLMLSGGKLLISGEEVPTVIAPMQAVLIKKTGASGTAMVKFTPAMQVQPDGTQVSRYASGSGLYISARHKGYRSECMLRISSVADNAYRPAEDAEILLDGEQHPKIEVFTVADGKALNIQQVKDATRIPLGVWMKKPGEVTLTFKPQGQAWNGWKLVDMQTGTAYTMAELADGVTLSGMKSQADRLVLVKE